jgi:hypothetical protein
MLVGSRVNAVSLPPLQSWVFCTTRCRIGVDLHICVLAVIALLGLLFELVLHDAR